MSGQSKSADYYSELIGKEIKGAYRIEELIGAGGMGAVFRAVKISDGSLVAIKVVSPFLTSSQVFVKRFRREARVGSALSHPNIIKVHEFGEAEDNLLFMVMDFVEGMTLSEFIRMNAPVSPERCLKIIEPLCDALDVAHKRNLLHRDLKPSNVLISGKEGEEKLKLADFGIVKLLLPDEEISLGSSLTELDEVFGTPHYMSPEQLMGHQLGPATDIYSLGVITHELLTGDVPVDANDLREFISLKVNTDLPPPSLKFKFLSPEFDAVLLKVLDKDPDKRYQSVGEFLQDFKKTVAEHAGKTVSIADSLKTDGLKADSLKAKTENSEAPTAALLAKPAEPSAAASLLRPYLLIAAGVVLLLIALIVLFFQGY